MKSYSYFLTVGYRILLQYFELIFFYFALRSKLRSNSWFVNSTDEIQFLNILKSFSKKDHEYFQPCANIHSTESPRLVEISKGTTASVQCSAVQIKQKHKELLESNKG